MPPRGQGPRLWLRRERRDAAGRVSHPAVWIIRDGGHQQSTGCGANHRGDAERALAGYLASKHVESAAQGQRRPDQIPVADVLAVYGRDVSPRHARPKESGQRMTALLDFFEDVRLSQVNGALCRRYAQSRSSDASARRELEDLRAAVNHYHREGHVRETIAITLPARRPARDRWLERSEAARLVRGAWRYRERQNFRGTDRATRKHIARFVLVGLYTGRRAGAIMQAALQPEPGRGHIDLDRGVFLPAPTLKRTRKRQPPIPLPRRLLAHMRRWRAAGQRYVVEWNGHPVTRIGKAFRAAVKAAGLAGVTPHTLRHTAATWMMQRGADPWSASGYLGMSLQTLTRTYGHHHPDHLKGAWSVFDRAGGTIKPKQARRKGRGKAVHASKRPRRTARVERRK